MSSKRILVTGGAGFIGSALVRHLIKNTDYQVLVYDALTYAGTLGSLKSVENSLRFRFVKGDICDETRVGAIIREFKPDIVTHLAAESHVDRSIDGPQMFIQTNVVGTFNLLQRTLEYWRTLGAEQRDSFRLHHISTDEVFGSLGETGYFSEQTPYDPRSPYSATKASSDHLVSAWWHTFGLPVLVTNCSNNYGPFHFPEKLIPLMILKALAGEDLPVYGQGLNVRDWLFVEDHVRALQLVFERGIPGERYNIGGNSERRNIDVVRAICAALDKLSPHSGGKSYAEQIAFVADRPGHDQRYAIDCRKIRRELGWSAVETFDSGLEKTVSWYLSNSDWWRPIFEETRALARRGFVEKQQ